MPSPFDLAPSEWATLRRLLDDVLDRPPAERPTWVEQLDARYDAFKPHLRALIAHVDAGSGARWRGSCRGWGEAALLRAEVLLARGRTTEARQHAETPARRTGGRPR